MVDYLPKPIKNAAGKAFLRAKNSILGLYDGVKKSDVGIQKQTEDNTDLTTHENEEDDCIRVEMSFNSLMIKFFQGNDNNDLIQLMLAYIKTQVKNPRMPEGGFSLHKIMHLHINFHRLAFTLGSSQKPSVPITFA